MKHYLKEVTVRETENATLEYKAVYKNNFFVEMNLYFETDYIEGVEIPTIYEK